MTSRELRNQRRAAERKAQKLARKAQPATSAQTAQQFVSQNAAPRHSTGPRTPEGKAISSRNSLKHGLASGALIVPGEDRADFDELLQSLLRAPAPLDATEQLLVEQMAQSHWLSQRALRLQNECFTDQGIDDKRLALFLRYFTTHERAFYKALHSLMRLQKERRNAQRVQFVSHRSTSNAQPAHFGSQNTPASLMLDDFVSQDGASCNRGTHFVSQNGYSIRDESSVAA